MDYKIHISGLAQGKYEYEFPVKGDLFREYGNQQVIDADITAKVILEKGSGWMNAHLEGSGKVTVECDRCLEEMDIPIEFSSSLAIRPAKLGEDTEDSDEFIIVDPSEAEVDLKQFIYDYICVSLPMVATHPEGECNPEMLAKIEALRAGQEKKKEKTETYSPFSGLKDLLDKGGKQK
ncbi:MAG: DUF177 domain-containing protein [Bacteroidales bacterium]|nr:DUF177 domain-containing protein [Bacteroidales bacterium]